MGYKFYQCFQIDETNINISYFWIVFFLKEIYDLTPRKCSLSYKRKLNRILVHVSGNNLSYIHIQSVKNKFVMSWKQSAGVSKKINILLLKRIINNK